MGPELAASLEPILVSTTGRLNGSATNGPAAVGNLLVIHALGLIGKIVFLFLNALAALASGCFQLGNLSQHRPLLPVPQFVQTALNPFLGVVLSVKGSAQFPRMLTGVVEV